MILWSPSVQNRIAGLIAIGMSLFLPHSIFAEAIQWKFKSTISTDNGASWISMGEVTLAQYDPSLGDYSYSQAHAYGLKPGSIGDPDAILEGPMEVRLATLGNQDYGFTSIPPSQPLSPNFRVKLEVFDVESGESGIAEFTGTLVGLGPTVFLDQMHTVDIGIQPQVHTFDLGKTRYSFDVRDGFTEDTSGIWADVTMSPLVQTPEPSALILFGMGFSALAFRKRQKQVAI